MSESAISSTVGSNELMSISEATRKVLGKNSAMPVADVMLAVKQITGKAPSKALVYQIKAKLKNIVNSKAPKAKLKKVQIKHELVLAKESLVSKESLKWVAANQDNNLDVAIIKISKIREYIKEFGSKESLIAWANIS
jgi:hypothetical protein